LPELADWLFPADMQSDLRLEETLGSGRNVVIFDALRARLPWGDEIQASWCQLRPMARAPVSMRLGTQVSSAAASVRAAMMALYRPPILH
jgi:hypothetical protein